MLLYCPYDAPSYTSNCRICTLKMDHILLSGGYLMNENKPESITAGRFDSLNQYQNMIFSSLGIGFRLTDRAKLKLGYQFYNTRFKRSAASAFIMEGDLSQHQLVAALEFFSPGDITWGICRRILQHWKRRTDIRQCKCTKRTVKWKVRKRKQFIQHQY